MPFSVTLVTGDRVSARSAAGEGLSVQPAKGRERVTFSVEQAGGSVFVIPSDARALVSSGTVDRRLFDVTGLIRDGYHDAARPTVPLIVTTQGAGAARSARGLVTAPNVTVTRELPAVDSLAVSARKADAATFWARVIAGGRWPT